jgi:iron complex transport system substrate-binding protein
MRRTLIATAVVMIASAPWHGAVARVITDMTGRKVEVPERIERVACLEVLCYPRMFMLGAADRVVMMVDSAAPWMLATNPQVASIPRLTGDANLEDLLVRKVDTAFFLYNTQRMLAKLTSVGIPALIAQPAGRQPDTAKAFADDAKAMVRLYGRALGGEAEKRAEDWCSYFDERTAYVAARIADMPRAARRKLYYVRGPQALSTQGRGGYTYWMGEMAGANMVIGAAPLAGRGMTSMEDIVRWDPDVILVGRQYPLDLVLDDPRWRTVSAVRDGKVLPMPAGVFYWDGGPESMLLILFIAKLLYPERFADLDMTTELKTYYARFYRTPLTDHQAAKVLRGEWPDGRRFNPMNN